MIVGRVDWGLFLEWVVLGLYSTFDTHGVWIFFFSDMCNDVSIKDVT